MSAELIQEFLESSSDLEKLRFQLAFHCAPVLKGIKASNILVIPNSSWQPLLSLVRTIPVSCICLHRGADKCVVLLFRYHLLERHLHRAEIQDFLKEYGYTDTWISLILKRLKHRYAVYSSSHSDFPHELGALLEYPLHDVIGFIDNKGQNCLLSGYWKVYREPEKALERFRLYDRAREELAMAAISGTLPPLAGRN